MRSIICLEVGSLTLWPAHRLAHWHGQAVSLTSSEFSLLELLARNAGRPVSRRALSMDALRRQPGSSGRTLDVHIHCIRSKLGKLDDGSSCIQTIHRVGYQFIEASGERGAI